VWQTDKKTLRQFGFILGGVFAVVFGLLIPWAYALAWPLWPWIAAVISVFTAIVFPIILLPVFVLLTILSAVIGRLVNLLVLTSVFLLMVIPVAIIFKLRKKDILQKHFDDNLKSYFIRTTKRDLSHMEKPY